MSTDGTTAGKAASTSVEISANGRSALLQSLATDLVTVPDANGAADGFVRDLLLGTTALLTL